MRPIRLLSATPKSGSDCKNDPGTPGPDKPRGENTNHSERCRYGRNTGGSEAEHADGDAEAPHENEVEQGWPDGDGASLAKLTCAQHRRSSYSIAHRRDACRGWHRCRG